MIDSVIWPARYSVTGSVCVEQIFAKWRYQGEIAQTFPQTLFIPIHLYIPVCGLDGIIFFKQTRKLFCISINKYTRENKSFRQFQNFLYLYFILFYFILFFLKKKREINRLEMRVVI